MQRKTLLTALLVFTVALAGCTQLGGDSNNNQNQNQITVTQNDGLSIGFSSVSREYYTGEQARFEADVENTGEAEATLQSMQLYGASWAADTSLFSGTETLTGAEPSNNIAGGSSVYPATVGLGSISLSQGQQDSYSVGLQTEYAYSTTARSTITLMDEQTYRENSNTRTQMQTSTTAGPVRVSFKGNTPYPDRDSTVSIPVQVTDVGDGRLAEDDQGTPVITSLEVTVEGEDVTILDRSGSIKIYEGSRQFFAEVDTSQSSNGDQVFDPSPESSYTLIARANYTYVEQDQTQVTVIGQ